MKTTEIVSLVLLVVSSYISTTESEECTVGSMIQNLSNTINSYPINEVYLNTRNPSTCAGLVYNITYCYLVPAVGPVAGLNEATFALWEPTGNDSYKQVADSLSDINFDNVGCPPNGYTVIAIWQNPTGNQAQSIICRQRCFQPPLAVSQGYVLGLNLSSNDTSKRSFIAETTLPITTGSSSSADGVCIASKVQGSSDEEYRCDNGTTSNNRTLLLYTTVFIPESPSISSSKPIDHESISLTSNQSTSSSSTITQTMCTGSIISDMCSSTIPSGQPPTQSDDTELLSSASVSIGIISGLVLLLLLISVILVVSCVIIYSLKSKAQQHSITTSHSLESLIPSPIYEYIHEEEEHFNNTATPIVTDYVAYGNAANTHTSSVQIREEPTSHHPRHHEDIIATPIVTDDNVAYNAVSIHS